MSLIQTIRDKASWLIVAVITLAIVGFIFMDAGRRGSIFGGSGRKTSMGSVNGTAIKADDYNARLETLKNIYRDNPQATDEALERFIWNSMVEESLMKDELDRLGGNLGDKELVDIAVGKYGEANQHVKQLFQSQGAVDPQTGQLNQPAAERAMKQALKSSDKTEEGRTVRSLLKMVRFEYLMTKHQQLMGATTFVPAWMAKKQLAENNRLAKISAVQVPYTELNDSLPELKISDDEIKKEMAKTPALYKQDENRVIDYVMYAFTPTAGDSAIVRSNLEAKRNEFEKVPDSMTGSFLNNNNSRTNYSDAYVRKKEIAVKADSNAVYTVNKTYGPYLDGANYTLAKVVAEKNVPDSVRCRHILVKIADDQRGQVLDDSVAKKRIDSIELAIKNGADFNQLVTTVSDDEGSKNTKGEYTFPYSQYTGISREFADVVFYEPEGTKKIVRVQNNKYIGYHYIEVLKHYAVSPGYKMAYLTRPIVPSEPTRDSARALAEAFAANNRDAKAFDDYVVKNPGKVVKLGPAEITKDAAKLPGFDADNVRNTFIKWVYNAKAGEISEAMPLEQSYRFVVAKLAAINPQGMMPVQKIRPQIENQLRMEKKYALLVKKYGRPATLQEAVTKTGKQAVVADSVNFESASIPGMAAEPRVVGFAFNPAYKGKVSGPIKGSLGIYYIQSEGDPYPRPNAATDENAFRLAQQKQQQRYNMGGGGTGYRKTATIKDKRLD